jgi:hypothetical protein
LVEQHQHRHQRPAPLRTITSSRHSGAACDAILAVATSCLYGRGMSPSVPRRMAARRCCPARHFRRPMSCAGDQMATNASSMPNTMLPMRGVGLFDLHGTLSLTEAAT